MKKKLGFIGCGEWARKKYLPYLNNRTDIEVTAVSNIVHNDEKLLLNEKLLNAKIFESYQQMIGAMHFDGLIVTLPHSLHYDAAKHALEKHIPTMVDKPLCPDLNTASKLVSLSIDKQTTLGVSGQRRSHTGTQFIHTLIKENKMGKVLWFDAKYILSSYENWEQTWRNNPKLSGQEAKKQGILLDTGYHLLDAILYLLEYRQPLRVFCATAQRNCNVDHDATAVLEFSDNLRVNLFVSRGLPSGNGLEKIEVLGENGYAVSEILEINNSKKTRIVFEDNQKLELTEKTLEPDFALQPIKDFIEHLSGSELPEIWQAKNTLTTLKVMDALYESSINHSVVSL